jgi:murein DD-endopeptidase MepM/ murein hydrolase activator NlpD
VAKNKNFTLMIVPEAHAQVRRVQIPKKLVYSLGVVAIGALGLLGAVFVHYAYVVDQVFEARTLRDENARLASRIVELKKKIEAVDARLAEVRRFDEKLRSMTDLRDEERGLAMGPLRPTQAQGEAVASDVDPFAVPVDGDDPAVTQLKEALLDSRLVGLAHEASREMASLAELSDYFGQREVLLTSTPSIPPTHGLLTSGFGSREDPFTGDHTMHAGLDIASTIGAEVVAPGSGTVIFAGDKGAYGNTIAVDHGRDIVTIYGHLSRILVKVGDRVERGQHIAAVGNSGRSTGPHLHYEVRVNNIPVNPRRFVVH